MITPGLRDADDDLIREALEVANPLALRGLVYYCTGDETLADIEVPLGPGMLAQVPTLTDPNAIAMLRAKAFDLLASYRDGAAAPPETVDAGRLKRALALGGGHDYPDEHFEFWREEIALEPMTRRLKWKAPPDPAALETFDVVVIGAGLAGATAAIQLKIAGFPFVVFEKNASVGGTWHQNRYPGARVDAPSRNYSHSFSVNFQFQHVFAPQPENERYVNWCFDNHNVREHVRFNTEVESLTWQEAGGIWLIKARSLDGTITHHRARAVIMAVGLLDRPAIPSLPGLNDFAGDVFHTTKVPEGYEFAGKRLALVGTGASGMQMAPEVAGDVASLAVYQRSPAWVVPYPGYRDALSPTALWLDRNAPFYVNFHRHALNWSRGDYVAYKAYAHDPEWKDDHSVSADNHILRDRLTRYLNEKIGDRPDLIAKCLPGYPPLSKRPVLDNGWFDMLRRDDVELVTEGIAHFTTDGVVDRTGRKREADVVVLATGFRANDYFWPMQIEGRAGIGPADVWARDGARAYWGVTVPGLPNLFVVYGPNTNPRGGGPIQWGESQVRYALQCMEALIANNWKSIEVKQQAFDEFNERLDERLNMTIWMDPRQTSYYHNQFGRSSAMAPWGSIEYWQNLRTPRLEDYMIEEFGDD